MVKRTFKPTPVAAAVKPVETVKTEPNYVYQPTETTPEATEQSVYERMRAAVNDYLKSAEAPSWTRKLVATTLGLIASAGVFYMSMGLVDMLCVAAITYTGIGFLAFLAAFLGIAAALMLSVTTGSRVFDMVMSFDYPRVKARIAATKARVIAKFNSKEIQHA